MKLPTHDEATAAVKQGKATALERFVYEYEPAGVDDEREFREALAHVLDEVKGP